MMRWMSSGARSSCIHASDRDFARDLISADRNFFSAVSTTHSELFPHFKFYFPQAKKIARAYCIHENVDLHCTHFRAGRSMADVNGAKVSLVTRWVTKRTRHGCSFADVNVSQCSEKQGFSRQRRFGCPLVDVNGPGTGSRDQRSRAFFFSGRMRA